MINSSQVIPVIVSAIPPAIPPAILPAIPPAILPAKIGSVSHATLKTEEIIEAFSDELEFQIQRNADYYQCAGEPKIEMQRLLDILWDAREYNEETSIESGDYETGDEIAQSLIDALNTFTGEYQYFGSHQGDGSDFGYWIDWEYINDCAYSGEITVFSDLADIPEGFSGDAIVTNDHGNASGYRIESGEIVRVYFEAI